MGSAAAQLVHYPNGAVVPYDGANLAATAAALVNTGAYAGVYSGYGGYYPYHHLGKRAADADADAQLVHYPNGAVVPYDGANLAATAAALVYTGAYAGVYGGYGGYYPYHHLGKRAADADADAQLVYYPNGAVVPYDGANLAATAAALVNTGAYAGVYGGYSGYYP